MPASFVHLPVSMSSQSEQTHETKQESTSNGVSIQQTSPEYAPPPLVDNRTVVAVQRKMQDLANNSQQVKQQNHLQQIVSNSSQAQEGVQLRSLAQPIQRQLPTKGGETGEKVNGSANAVRTEVTAVIGRNRGGEMTDDIGKLERSIASREKEQALHEAGTESYQKHQHRIEFEEAQLERLREANEERLAAKPKKEKATADADGWTKV